MFGRLDHNFNDSNKMMLKYSKRLQDNQPSFPFPDNRIAGGSNSGGTAQKIRSGSDGFFQVAPLSGPATWEPVSRRMPGPPAPVASLLAS